ncbi:TRAP transporter large permease [Georgenia yuyongxinii]|uniref:TRAP transporter large permease n=1 Tax=Georgenia yuyongxinii TaxID=2589797 RepID=A0A5B8C773_9MICO|nr:TRAP transporter large permease [Georgenia yuyongxinii]QDC23776.1 TRAP transporter large permease [Georgenia yuyongxinii]
MTSSIETLPTPPVGDGAATMERPSPAGARGRRPHLLRWGAATVVWALMVAAVVLSIYSADSNLSKGGWGAALLILLLVSGVPVALCMLAVGLVGIHAIVGNTAVIRVLMDVPFGSMASWTLSVLPMFVLMGLILWSSGATERLYRGSQLYLGRLPGGLAVTTNLAGAGLAAASGSTVGITYALARIGVPEMLRAGYDKKYVLSSVLMSGMSGQLIPPSVLLVVYAGVAEVGIGQQLAAGIVPGLLLAASYATYLVIRATLQPRLAPKVEIPRVTMRERVRITGAMLPIPLLSIVVIGGMLLGVFTATEAGAFGAFGALIIGAVYLGRKKFVKAAGSALVGTASSVGQIMFLLFGTAVMSQFMALSGVPGWLVELVSDMNLSRVSLLLLLIAVYIVLGMFLDPIAMILLTVPVMVPILSVYEISPIWFGVFVVILCEVGMVTPPVGILSYVLHRIVQDDDVRLGNRISLGDVFKAALGIIPVALFVILLLIFFPDLVGFFNVDG